MLNRPLEAVRLKYAPDPHLAIFTVGAERTERGIVLTGMVDNASARHEAVGAASAAGISFTDRIEMLPSPELGDETWGLVCLSVATGRELPNNRAEMGTQVMMGHPVRIWNRSSIWYLVQSKDRYLSWMVRGAIVPCTRADVDAWDASPLLIVTAFEATVREEPQSDAPVITDVVTTCLVKRIGEAGEWFKVELPDRRMGYLPKPAAEDYRAWRQNRQPTPDHIERTARSLLGRPYLWGANSPQGMDCSGFTKLVFFLNGIELDRNASHQCQQGVELPLDAGLSRLKKGDLLFFGRRAIRGQPERITHTGIYLGEKLFIHSSERVRISSLGPASPLRDERRIQTLLHARRVLPES